MACEIHTVAILSDLECVFASVVEVALAFAGIILFIMLVVGGFKYITSGGDPKGVDAAKKTLTYAIGGVILLALSFLILVLIEQFTGANVTNFQIYRP